jgi:hypothetical protein
MSVREVAASNSPVVEVIVQDRAGLGAGGGILHGEAPDGDSPGRARDPTPPRRHLDVMSSRIIREHYMPVSVHGELTAAGVGGYLKKEWFPIEEDLLRPFAAAGVHFALAICGDFIDRELYLPEEWALDKERRERAGVPEEVGMPTKSELVKEMLGRALEAGVKAGWVGSRLRLRRQQATGDVPRR